MEDKPTIPDSYWEKERSCHKDCSKAVTHVDDLDGDNCFCEINEIITNYTYEGGHACFVPKPEPIELDLSNQDHYTTGSIEPWDYIIANKLDFLEGNVVKYITRYKHKGTPLEDLEKIKVYVNKIIEGLDD